MSRRLESLSLFALIVACLAAPVGAEPGPWSFRPDSESAAGPRLLDLREMNEKQSGESGFVRLAKDRNSFVRGDGQPIRFWAVGSEIYKKPRVDKNNPPAAEELARQWQDRIDRHCRFLARLGVNMVRLHTTVAATKEGAEITDVNREVIEGIFRFIKAAKENGIYLTISPYYGHHATPKSWRLPGYDKGQRPWGAIFVDPRMQSAYRTWTRVLYTTKNPHTGLAIKDDPTVAILQVHNEDSLFFWTAQDLPQPQQQRLAVAFAAWLVKKYGSLDKAVAAWDGRREKADNAAAGKISLYSTWHMTRDWPGGTNKRLRDQIQFLAEFQRAFYASMGRYLREELGCQQLLNATNWRTANDERLKALERWTYAALDIDAENEYYGSDYQHLGANHGYRIDPGHKMVNESCLHKPLELTTNFKTHVGHPFIVTETSWKHPNLYQSEGPFLVAAYQSLGGVDAVFWFTANAVEWLEDPRRLFWPVGDSHALDKWSCSTPMLMGMFPAAAVIYRRGYLKEGEPVAREVRPLESLWRREPARIEDNEIYGVSRETAECKSPQRADGRISRAAFLVGPVQVEYRGDAAKTKVADFAPQLKASRGEIHSNTGQLVWNYEKGACAMLAPKAQGVAGFLRAAGGRFELPAVTIHSQNDYASVSVVSLDDKPLAESRKILIQVGTTARLKGWQTKPVTFDFKKQKIEGLEIVNSGKPPWQIAATQATVTLKNTFIQQARRVTLAGRDGGAIPLKQTDRGCTVTLPADVMHVVLRSE